MKSRMLLIALLSIHALIGIGCSTGGQEITRRTFPPPDDEALTEITLHDRTVVAFDGTGSERWHTIARPTPHIVVTGRTSDGDSISISADRILEVRLRSTHAARRITPAELVPSPGEVLHSITLRDSTVIRFDENGGEYRRPPGDGSNGWLIVGQSDRGDHVQESSRNVIEAHIRGRRSPGANGTGALAGILIVIAINAGLMILIQSH